uniref:Uncharacterized protein n=1 Tax=Picea glauca TaxID=3330 RepID=A0A101M4B9_PICGL|nr:hypothetical protein ABT39_MTgene543 [Picea glauca]QHR89401.1 hypothetical protein Q903MT_gene3422 [Picea sitchensis]
MRYPSIDMNDMFYMNEITMPKGSEHRVLSFFLMHPSINALIYECYFSFSLLMLLSCFTFLSLSYY